MPQQFHAPKPDRTPHQATIDGYYVTGDDPDRTWSLDLEFLPVVPFHQLNVVLRAFGTIDGKLVTNGLDVQQFMLDACLNDGYREALADLLTDVDRAVDMTTLAAVVMWLIECYSDRPTTR